MIIHSPFPFPLLSTLPPNTHSAGQYKGGGCKSEFFKQDSKVRENLERSLTVLPAGVGGAVSQEEQVVQFHLDALWNTLPCIQLQEEKVKGLMMHCVVYKGINLT